MSRRDVVELCEQLFVARISIGSVEAILRRAADALAGPHTALLDAVRASRHLNIDETGWRLRGARRALSAGAFTDRYAIFDIHPGRFVGLLRDFVHSTQPARVEPETIRVLLLRRAASM